MKHSMHDITGTPDPGVVNPTLEELQKQPPSYLFEEQEAQLRKAPVIFNLFLQLATEGDPIDDTNALWPDDRPLVRIGRLESVLTREPVANIMLNPGTK
jgi:catalase